MKITSITCLLICAFLTACSSSFQTGKQDAVRDFDNGIMQIETYGLRTQSNPYEENLAKRGINMKTVAGCVVNDEIIDHAKGYNTKMVELIKEKFGSDVFGEARSNTKP